MNRLDKLFIRKNHNLLAVYFTAGYPRLESTVEIIDALCNAGADIIEIGIPFSDPMADGKVIQMSSQVALANGINLATILRQTAEARAKNPDTPFVAMGYINPMMQYGMERFFADANAAGIDGLIVPDLPFEIYMSEIKPLAERHDLRVIMLITPETSDERIRLIDANCSGFIYMVSSASTTGQRDSFSDEQTAYFRRIKEMDLTNPLMIGFGVSNRPTRNAALESASGVIVGSKFISLLTDCASPGRAVSQLFEALGM